MTYRSKANKRMLNKGFDRSVRRIVKWMESHPNNYRNNLQRLIDLFPSIFPSELTDGKPLRFNGFASEFRSTKISIQRNYAGIQIHVKTDHDDYPLPLDIYIINSLDPKHLTRDLLFSLECFEFQTL